MSDVKLFIGSSGTSVEAGRLIRDRLQELGCASVTVWNESIFTLNLGVLERLLSAVNEFDFGVMIWGPDDVTASKGESGVSPRDNVIFECGLFMGKLGRERVFIVYDKDENVKIPSDFAGITLAHYYSSLIKTDGKSAVMDACDKIAAAIKRVGRTEFVGEWRSRFVKNAEPGHPEIIDDLYIVPWRDGVLINSLGSKIEPYTAQGRIYGNQVIGDWQHKSGENFVDGTFMLVVNPRATVLYGYCTGRDERGGMIFATWVLAKKEGLAEDEIKKNLGWGQRELRLHTMKLPLTASGNVT
jgi:hypothetical protein